MLSLTSSMPSLNNHRRGGRLKFKTHIVTAWISYKLTRVCLYMGLAYDYTVEVVVVSRLKRLGIVSVSALYISFTTLVSGQSACWSCYSI